MRVLELSSLLAASLVMASGQCVLGQGCVPQLAPGFGSFENGLNNKVHTLTVGDLGQGPRLFATGTFSQGSGTALQGVAQWDGTQWSPIGGVPVYPNPVLNQVPSYSSVVFDDGTSPALFLAGPGFSGATNSIQSVIKWDGSAWSNVGQPLGLSNSTVGARSLRVLDDGQGPKLYAVGTFWPSQGPRYVARLEGGSWVQVGPSLSTPFSDVNDIAVFDSDGAGPLPPKVYIATAALDNIYSLEGGVWTPAIPSSVVSKARTLTVYDDGSGSALYAFGDFTLQAAQHRAAIRLKDGVWSEVGQQVWPGSKQAAPQTLVFDDGSGTALWVSGDFVFYNQPSANSSLMKWDGHAWEDVASVNGAELSIKLASYPHQGRPTVFAAGGFTFAGTVVPNEQAGYIAAFQGCVGSCTADFNGDGDFGTDADIEAFFACLAGDCCATCLTSDFNGDGDFGTDADIESFFRVLAGGPC